jgi:hypothetical protein
MIKPSESPGHDVDYTFGQVSIDAPFVDYGGNCGNLTYADLSGRLIEPGDTGLTARVISLGALHKAFAVTTAICTAGAAQIEGSVVHEMARIDHHPEVRVGHPGGVLPVGARVATRGAHFQEAVLERTARRLMEGSVLVPAATFSEGEEYA